MTLAQFVPFLPEIVLAAAGFAVLLLGVPLGRGGVRPLVGQRKPEKLLDGVFGFRTEAGQHGVAAAGTGGTRS